MGYLFTITYFDSWERYMRKLSFVSPLMEDEYDGTFPIPTKEEGDGPQVAETVDIDNQEVADSTADIVIDISSRDEMRQGLAAYDKEIMLHHLRFATQLSHNYTAGIIGQEDFSSFVSNGLAGIGNVIGHIANLFKVSLFHGWRDFKRGEMAEYCDSNVVTMRRLYGLNYNEYRLTHIPYPEGMKGMYLPALSSLKAFLDELDLLKRTDKMLATIVAIHGDLVRTNPSFKSHVADFHRIFVPSRHEKLFNETSKFFTTKKEVKTDDIFSARFSSIKDYETVVKMSVEMDTHLRSVSSVHSRMQEMESWMNRIIELGPKLEKAHIADLVKIATTLATVFDSYATVINDVNRVGHNLVFVTDSLRRAADL